MREQGHAMETLHRAIAAVEAATGLHIEARPPLGEHDHPTTLLDVFIDDRVARFAAEIKLIDRFHTLGTIAARGPTAPHPPLLVAPYVTEAAAERCRQLHLPFIDEAGNAYIEAPGLFVYVTGKRRPVHARVTPAFRALTPAGLRIVFALLEQPAMAAAPYRDIARAAGVALGTVGEVLADLEERGHLAPGEPGPRRLLAPERLREEWVTHYPIKLRPKLKPRRFTAPRPDWWRGQDIGQHHACWGGEIAAERLTGYLKPATVTIYVEGKPDRLILANRLRPDVEGEVEILDAFWARNAARQPGDVAPPLVVYADLMATADTRNIEAANLIHDRFLANAGHPA